MSTSGLGIDRAPCGQKLYLYSPIKDLVPWLASTSSVHSAAMAYPIPEAVLDELADLSFDITPLEAAAHADDGCCSSLIQSNLSLFHQAYDMLQQVNLELDFSVSTLLHSIDYLISL